MTTTREQASIALFNKLSTITDFKFKQRRAITSAALASTLKPALILLEKPEKHERGKQQTDAVRYLNFDAWVLIDAGLDKSATPIIVLNNLMDKIDPQNGGVLKADQPQTNRCTLGNLVYDCYIAGEVVKVPGDLDGQGALFIPITVVFTQAG